MLLPETFLCCARLFQSCPAFCSLWTVVRQAPLSMRFSRQESWSGLPFPPPGNLSDPGIEAAPLISPALTGGLFTILPPVCVYIYIYIYILSCCTRTFFELSLNHYVTSSCGGQATGPHSREVGGVLVTRDLECSACLLSGEKDI